MSLFGHYARYYDLLYDDKNYANESEFMHQCIQHHRPTGTRMLELGCGTGKHVRLLIEKDSQTMCQQSRPGTDTVLLESFL